MKIISDESLLSKIYKMQETVLKKLANIPIGSYEYNQCLAQFNMIAEFKHMVNGEPVAYDIEAVLNELDKMRAKPMELVYDIPLIDHIYEIVRNGGGKSSV